jgi:hypothetical protein
MVPSVLTACLLCLALLTDAATALRAYRCCAATPRRRWRAAVPRLCNEQRTLGDPATMPAIDAALRQDAVAPQLGAEAPAISRGVDGLEPLREDELSELEELEEPAPVTLSNVERSLLQRSLDSLDYSGNWSDPAKMRDSMVLACVAPEVGASTLNAPEISVYRHRGPPSCTGGGWRIFVRV